MKQAAPIMLLAAGLFIGAGSATGGTVYYLGGSDPGTGTWLAESWTNLRAQVENINTNGGELRIAWDALLTRDIARTLGITNANVKVTGGWDTTGGVWTRKDLSLRGNRTIIECADALGYYRKLFVITAPATNVLLEGLWIRGGATGLDRDENNNPLYGTASYTAGNLDAYGAGLRIESCSFSNARKPYGSHRSVRISGVNSLIRRCCFLDNDGVSNSENQGEFLHVTVTGVRIAESEFHNVEDPGTGIRDSVIYSDPGTGNVCYFDNCVVRGYYPFRFFRGTLYLVNCTLHGTPITYTSYGVTRKVHLRNTIFSETGDFIRVGTDEGNPEIYIRNSLVDELSTIRTNSLLTVDCDTASLDMDATHPANFKDAANGDFRISLGSAAINLGTNTYLTATYQGAVESTPANLQTDLAGSRRVRDYVVDAGAYEFQPPRGTVISVK